MGPLAHWISLACLKASVSGFLRSLVSAFEASNAHPKGPYSTPLLSTAKKKSASPRHAIGKPGCLLGLWILWFGWFGGQHPFILHPCNIQQKLASSQGTQLPWRCLVLQQLRSHRWRNNGWPDFAAWDQDQVIRWYQVDVQVPGPRGFTKKRRWSWLFTSAQLILITTCELGFWT